MIFYAIKTIKRGDEVFTNYNGTPNDTTPLAPCLTSFKKSRLPDAASGSTKPGYPFTPPAVRPSAR